MFDGEPPHDICSLKRYWLVTTEAPGFSGGIGVYTHHTAKMFAAQGVAVTVLHYDPDVHDPVCGFGEGYRTVRFAKRGLDRRPIEHANLQGPLRIAREAGEMVRALITAEGPPDVVEFQDYGALAHAFLKHRLMYPQGDWPRVVLTAHRPHVHCVVTDGDSPHEHRTAFLADAERWCYAAADAVLAPCRFILEPLKALGFPLPRVEVVHNPYAPAAGEPDAGGLEPEALELARALHTLAEPVLVFGKLQAQKGAPDLLATLDALHTEREAPPVWLFGRDAFLSDSPTTVYDALERRHRRLFQAGRVRYLGGYGVEQMRALCRNHPVVALPYREDCLPYAFIEAVVAGALPLTSARGGQAELIPPDLHDLLTADVRRPDQWAAKLRALLALEPSARARLSGRLAAAVTTKTDPARVFAAKIAALAPISPVYLRPDYPFVHPAAKRFEDADPERRSRLSAAVPQLGATRRVRSAGPDVEPHPELISVVVPYFDMHAHVDETLAAIEAQDHAAVELVIVDDGSPCPAAQAKLDHILASPRRYPTRVLRKTNGGLADARNAGAKLAHGAYLYFLDADDIIHPSTLSCSLMVLKRFRNVAYVGACLKEFGESDGEWTVFDIDGPYIGFHNLQICAFLVRAEAWLQYGFNNPALRLGMEDYESHVRMFAHDVRGIAIPETLFSYRKRAGSMSKAFEPHAVASLYRHIWQANPELLRRFGPELVGLYAENGHGALAPSVGEPSPHHAALFRRDIPALEEIAEDLEACASREGLGRALRARCAAPSAEWDYTTARLLLALDMESALARSLLRDAVERAPQNGWFRLYAMIAELRDGRIGAADALWTDDFSAFCAQEAGAVGWIGTLDGVRGFPHVTQALKVWLAARAHVEIASPMLHLGAPQEPLGGEFGALHEALDQLRGAGRDGGRRVRDEAEDAVRRAAAGLSGEAVEALIRRWSHIWRMAKRPGDPAQRRTPTFWGAACEAYVGPRSGGRTGLNAIEAADQALWAGLTSRNPGSGASEAMVALSRKLLRQTPLAVQ